MMRAPWAIALLAGGGCAQILGINPTSAAGNGGGSGGAGNDAGSADAPAGEVTLAVQRMSVGATVVRAPQDLSTSSASFLVADGSATGGYDRVSTMVTAPGTWAANIASGAPPAYFTLPDYLPEYPRLYDLGVRDVSALYPRFEHPNPQPMPTGATLQFDVKLASPLGAGDYVTEYSAGSWTEYSFALAQAATAVDQSVAGSAFSSITGAPLSAFTTDDAMLVLEYSSGSAVVNTLVGAFIGSGFDQTGSDTIAGSMQPVALNQTLSVTVPSATVPTRYAAEQPAMTVSSMEWSLTAAPAPGIGGRLGVTADVGPLLNAGDVTATQSGAITATYGNPFSALGWDPVFLFDTFANRTYTLPVNGLQAFLSSELYAFASPTGGLAVSLSAGLPIAISVNNTPLVSDGMTVAIDPTQPVDISFQTDQPNCTFVQLLVIDLLPNATSTGLQYFVVLEVDGVGTDHKVPPDAFVVGHNYTVRAACNYGGFPNIATGDLTSRSLPRSGGFLDSGVFTVSQ